MFKPIDSEDFKMYLEGMSLAAPMVPVDPSDARKLLRDLAAWSQSIGFSPHGDFAVERIFGDVSADASNAVSRFGRDGKPVYMPGPNDSASSGSGSRTCKNISARTVSTSKRPFEASQHFQNL